MSADGVLGFARRHGIVLVSAKGVAPNVAEFIAGGPIRGSWWGHPKGKEIFRQLAGLAKSREFLVCRLVDGKLTLVHRRLWPALVRLSHRLPRARLAQVREEHTDRGHHVRSTLAYPRWVSPLVAKRAARLDEAAALALLDAWIRTGAIVIRRARRKRT